MTLEAMLGGLVVVVAAFGFAMAYAARSPHSGNRRDHDEGGPGLLLSDATPAVGLGAPGDAGDGGTGNGGGGFDGGGGDGGGDSGGGDSGGGDGGSGG